MKKKIVNTTQSVNESPPVVSEVLVTPGPSLYKQDQIVRDLRASVLEVLYNTPVGQRTSMLTLQLRLLPKTYTQNIQEQQEERAWHQNHPESIVGWDAQKGGWVNVMVSDIVYISARDNF